jgi:hypothetical protein
MKTRASKRCFYFNCFFIPQRLFKLSDRTRGDNNCARRLLRHQAGWCGLLCGVVLVLAPAAWATTYYSQGSFAANLTSSWNTVRTGGGSSPSGFTSGDTFIIQNGHNLTVSVTGGTTTNWAVSGTGNKVEIESGGKLTNSGDGSVPNITISGTFQIDGGGTYVMASPPVQTPFLRELLGET